ncbi:LacI family DNA-binding transcriptional regulator [Oceanispirochaeta sp.]|jgi:LacI family transcriptional regulator|uniref:LacI family DNA-binding transcriptional regulator n=1 Tax=Oceanispirochaeta sp. TaxID=2035350 RepID=UPI002612C4B9|nr:LacI family DNA-binding transcriptional regulator [Oceanispirochaeta sp.]MDA3957111.1 LacI family DNA-binding transcriptional regulator [Oceanispirochaeta sp.]
MAYIRLKDIAEKANVSINTVSRALKNQADIGDHTKKRIQQIADDLGYIPNASASRLRTKSNKMIGVIITHMDNAFYARILQGISDAVADLGYTILALSSNENLEKENSLLKTLIANRVDGTIIVPSRDLENTLDYDHLGVPHITIVRKGNRNTRSYFISDSHESGRIAARHFHSLNRSNPAYIGFDLPVSCNRDRLEGFQRELAEIGIPLKINRIRLCSATHEAAYDQAVDLLKNDTKIDSLFVYNDIMALGVIKAVYDLGISIPQDIRLLGHDDINDAKYYTPTLSSISVPKYRLGYDSATELVGIINDSTFAQRNVIYKPELIVRES